MTTRDLDGAAVLVEHRGEPHHAALADLAALREHEEGAK